MTRLKEFTAVNPTGTTPGMEPVDFALLKAAVANKAPEPKTPASEPIPAAPSLPPQAVLPQQPPTPALIAKNLRLPADLVDFIDYTFTKENRMKKQDAHHSI